ncbi:MAG TPA: PDZ domain-containing protein [Candidatus Binataceae bacterium]|nr:PDZ domain-containing protein [Candidatus Binataceae bacterium]
MISAESFRLSPVKFRSKSFAIALGVVVLAFTSFANGQDGSQSGRQQPGIAAQPGSAPPPPGMAGQGGDDTTLEIAPQPGIRPPAGSTGEIPGGRGFKPGEDTASINPNYQPNGQDNSNLGRRVHPYLGISVAYRTLCYAGKEEEGLEIINIDPGSPAEQAKLHSHVGASVVGAVGTIASTMLGPLNFITEPALIKSGAMGMNGDMIVAVDDHRVRTKEEFEAEISKLKPGDTMYLTVIRPMSGGEGGAHQTLKIAVKVGAMGEYADAGPGASPGYPQPMPRY